MPTNEVVVREPRQLCTGGRDLGGGCAAFNSGWIPEPTYFPFQDAIDAIEVRGSRSPPESPPPPPPLPLAPSPGPLPPTEGTGGSEESNEITVSAPRDTAPERPESAVGPFLTWFGAQPAPRPSPRRAPPRRRAKPARPAPRRRRPAPRRDVPIRPVKPSVLKRLASALLRVGRAANVVLGVLWPEDLGGGEREFLDAYYGGFYDSEDDSSTRTTNIGRLPDLNTPVQELTVIRTRIPEEGPRSSRPPVSPFVSPPLGQPWSPVSWVPEIAAPFVPGSRPQPEPQPESGPAPSPVRGPLVEPLPFAPGLPVTAPIPRPIEVPRTSPTRSPAPRPINPPLTAPIIPLAGLSPRPEAAPQQDPRCKCPPTKKKKQKKRDPRTECRSGTYRQLARGIVYQPKRKIPCQ